jgi:hypothetical protein
VNGAGVSAPVDQRRGALADVVIVLVTFAVLGVVGALVWNAVVSPPTFVRTTNGGEMDQVQLSRIVTIDGWFFTVGAVAGLVAGIVLMLLRPRRPILLVVLLTLGGALASWLMVHVGLAVGPPDPGPALAHAAVGTRAPVQLRPHASGVEFAWPGAALLGALLVLLLVSPRTNTAESVEQPAEQQAEESPAPS